MTSQLEVQKPQRPRGGRPKKDPQTITEIFSLRAQGKSIDQILNDLGDDRVSRGTVAKYTKQFDNSHETDKERYHPFEWHRLEEYGLPWESSAYLLEMWMRIREYWADEDKSAPPPGPRLPPTVRQVRWWWRVHLAVPDGVNTLDIYFWAEHLVRREMFSEVLDSPLDVADIEAYLAYKPWAGPDNLALYSLAVTEKRVEPLPDPFYAFELLKEIEASGALKLLEDVPTNLRPEYPDVRPSQECSHLLEELETFISNQPDESSKARYAEELGWVLEQAQLIKKRAEKWDKLSNVREEGKL